MKTVLIRFKWVFETKKEKKRGTDEISLMGAEFWSLQIDAKCKLYEGLRYTCL